MVYIETDASDVYRKMGHVDLLVNIQTEIAGPHIMEEWERHTHPHVPVLHHYLEHGFSYKLLSPPPVLQMQAQYDAVSNRGYHYALIQEKVEMQIKAIGRPFKHPRGGTSPYFEKGRNEVNVPGLWAFNLRKVL